MPRYKDIKLTGATQVSRRHSRDIPPPGLAVLKNGYISRSDNVPQVRPKLTPITDTLTSIPGTGIAVPTGDSAADYLNSYFYSWGANAGFYLTKYGPIYAAGDSSEVLYDTYDAGTFSCESANTTIVTFSVEDDASLIEHVWPGCLLLYSGTYYIFESIINESTAVLKTSPGAVTAGANTIIRVHNSDRADMPFNISQYGVNMVYSTPYYRLPMETADISGPFYLPLNDYVVASPWKDTSASVSFAPDVYGFPEWLRWHPTHAYERATAWRSAVPLIWHNGSLSSIYSLANQTVTANSGLLPAGPANVDDDATPRYTKVDPMVGYSTAGSYVTSQDWASLADGANIASTGNGWTRTLLDANNVTNATWSDANDRVTATVIWRSMMVHLKDSPSIKNSTVTIEASMVDPTGTGYTYKFGPALRASASAGYIVYLDMVAATIQIARYSGGTVTTIGSGATLVGKSITLSSRVYIKAEIDGSIIRAKTWLTSAAEPAAWDVTETDTTIAVAGLVGFWNNYRNAADIYSTTYYYDFDVTTVPASISPVVKSLAYGSEADGSLALYTGLADGSLIKTPMVAAYGANNAQHFMSFNTAYPTLLDNAGSRTTINRIRDVGYTLHTGDSEVWAVCDSGIILHDITSENEVDLGDIGSLYDVASSRRPKTGSSIDGDVVAVGQGGVIYYIPAEDDPDTAGNWTAATSGITNDLNWCLYSKYRDKFVAVAQAGDVLLSDNAQGDAWTAKTTPSSGYLILGVDCDEEGRVFVFVTSDNKVWATLDLATYTDVTPDSLDDETLSAVTYCLREGKFVIGGTDGYLEDVRLHQKIASLTSTKMTGAVTGVRSLKFFNSLYVAIFADKTIKTSPGGGAPWTWTQRQDLGGSMWRTGTPAQLINNGSVIIAAYLRTDSSAGLTLYTRASADGTTWGAEVEVCQVEYWRRFDVGYDSTNSKFVIGTSANVYFSADGAAWTGVAVGQPLITANAKSLHVDPVHDLLFGSSGYFKTAQWNGSTYVVATGISVPVTSFDGVDAAPNALIHSGDWNIITTSGNAHVRVNDASTAAAVEVAYMGYPWHAIYFTGAYISKSLPWYPVSASYDSSVIAAYLSGSAVKLAMFYGRSTSISDADVATSIYPDCGDYGVLNDGTSLYVYVGYGEDNGTGAVYKLTSIAYGIAEYNT